MEPLKRLIDKSREANENLLSVFEREMKKVAKEQKILISFRDVLKMIVDSNTALAKYLGDVDSKKYNKTMFDLAVKRRYLIEMIADLSFVSEGETAEQKELRTIDEFVNNVYLREVKK